LLYKKENKIADLDKITYEDFLKLQKIFKDNKKSKNGKDSYPYSEMTDTKLEKLVDIEQKINHSKFDKWFNNSIILDEKISIFLDELLKKEGDYIDIYDEEDLKMKFLSPIFVDINFKNENFRDFYDHKLTYEADKFIFNGKTDFVISTGLRRPKKPYFFIQEFKRREKDGFPRPQLIAELISAVELNSWKNIKGAYLVGEIWNFVILEKLGKDKYQYYISKNFDSSDIVGLKNIYKNLLFIKDEVIKMVDAGI